MPSGKPNVRRKGTVARRGAVRKGGREDEVVRASSAGFSHQAFLGVSAISALGFVTVLCQLYKAVSSEKGLDLGGVRVRLRGSGANRESIPTLPPGLSDSYEQLQAGNALPETSDGSLAYDPMAPVPLFDLSSRQPSLATTPDLGSRPESVPTQTQGGEFEGLPVPGSPEAYRGSPMQDQLRKDALTALDGSGGTPQETQYASPSSLAHQPEPEPHCKWREHPGRYLGELAVLEGQKIQTYAMEGPEDQARHQCIEAGSQCEGITCDVARTTCSARRGSPYLAVSPSNEISVTKSCTGVVVPAAESEGSLPASETASQPLAQEPIADSMRSSPDTLKLLPPGYVPPELDRSPYVLKPAGKREALGSGRAVLVVIAHNRPDCLDRCLRNIIIQPDAVAFDLAVSLDDPTSFQKMENVVQVHQNKHPGRKPMEVWKKPTAFLKTPVQKIAAHFKFALSEAFDHYHYEFGVFIENDLELAPDALWYFRAAAWLLEEDPSLFCISAWNDNGFKGLVSNEKRLFRTDYFPGLGWMIRNDTWTQLRGIWPVNPTTGWDHWVRHGSGLRPRECIVPEVSRSHHFDERGTNVKKGNGMARLLAKMAFSTLQPAELNDFSYLLKDKYEQQLTELLKNSQVTTIGAGGFDLDPTRTYLLPYIREEYKNIAKRLEIYGAQPRTAHRGMVMTRHPSTKALLILVDRRQAVGILPEIEQLRPNPQLRIGAAPKGRSCDWFCHLHQMRCDPAQLEFINHCSVLKEYFPCERGCGHQVGLEIPCYAHDSKMDTAFQCLVTDEVMPACKAGHKSTTRLCACVPV